MKTPICNNLCGQGGQGVFVQFVIEFLIRQVHHNHQFPRVIGNMQWVQGQTVRSIVILINYKLLSAVGVCDTRINSPS